MKLAIFGDVHCEFGELNRQIGVALKEHPDITHIIQVGDFGDGWPGKERFKYKFMRPLYWLPGNHENWDLLEADYTHPDLYVNYMPPGSVLEIENCRILFFGGATSIDKQRRTPHVSWWSQESISYGEIQRTLDTVKPPVDIIFSHEHPASFPYSERRYSKESQNVGKSDRAALDVLLKHYNPKFWFFGHHHIFDTGETNGTKWYCCPNVDGIEKKCLIFDGESTNWIGVK